MLPRPPIHSVLRLGLLGLLVSTTACFTGAEREKKPPPGIPGGLCLAPDGQCAEGTCNRDKNYCYDAMDPCAGFFCGGSDRGLCYVDGDGQPSCECNAGFQNETFSHYCCPIENVGDADCEAANASQEPASSNAGR
jgi:hypothetical protein